MVNFQSLTLKIYLKRISQSQTNVKKDAFAKSKSSKKSDN